MKSIEFDEYTEIIECDQVSEIAAEQVVPLEPVYQSRIVMKIVDQLVSGDERCVLLVEIERVIWIQIRDDRRAVEQFFYCHCVSASITGHDDQAATFRRQIAGFLVGWIVFEKVQYKRFPAGRVHCEFSFGGRTGREDALNATLALHD